MVTTTTCKHPPRRVERIPGATDTGTRYVKFRCGVCGRVLNALYVSHGHRTDSCEGE